MEIISNFVDFIDFNSEVKVGDFIVNTTQGLGVCTVITDLSVDRKLIDNRNKDSIILRPKNIDSYLIWEIWDAFREKCKSSNINFSLALFKRLQFDSKTLFENIKSRNTLRALVFFPTSEEIKEIITESESEADAIEELCARQPRLISRDDAIAILNYKWADCIKESINKLNQKYKESCKVVLDQLSFSSQ